MKEPPKSVQEVTVMSLLSAEETLVFPFPMGWSGIAAAHRDNLKLLCGPPTEEDRYNLKGVCMCSRDTS